MRRERPPGRRTYRRAPIALALAAAAALTVAFALLGASTARATFHGKNGRVAFRRYFNDAHTRGAIFTIRPDGTGLKQITHRGKVALDTAPDWSPDGRWIAFYRDQPGKQSRVFKMRANGSDITLLSHDPNVGDLFPAWSPDGRRIVFTRFDDSIGLVALFVMRADGSHVHQVPGTARYGAQFAQWSPDATRLVFEGFNSAGGEAIFTIRLDGTDTRRVTPWRLHAGDGPDWSPNGRWIVLESHDEQGTAQDNVFLVHPDGTDLHRITTSPLHVHQWGHYSFSPDGKMITVAHSPGVGQDGNADVWVMNLDGSGLRNVTRSVIFDSAPDWGSRPADR